MKPETDSLPHQNGTHAAISSLTENGNGMTSLSTSMEDLQSTALTPSGFSRHELVRLMVQSLQSLGYHKSAHELEEESGYQLESNTVTRFRECVLNGAWEELEQLSEHLDLDHAHEVSVKFLIREQKFLELLEAKQIKHALIVLRSELTPLNYNMDRVHTLTSFMMSSNVEDLRQRSEWDGAAGSSRQVLLSSLQKYISPAVMVPENRLETMLKQAADHQIKNCYYHNHTNESSSLYSDHICDKTGIPSVCRRVLTGHSNEVWFIAFSHNGKYLASASVDNKVIIWSLESFEAVRTLEGHQKEVSWCSWSPDDSQLLTTGFDKIVKLWDVKTGTCKANFTRHTDVVNCLAWLPDGERFLSGSGKFMILMTTANVVINTWQFHVRDLAVSADGKILVAMGGTIIRVIDLEDLSDKSIMEETDGIVAISLSKDGKFLLVNTTPKHDKHPLNRDVHLWNISEGRIVSKYSNYMQGMYVIRPCFGGLDERFVICGGEDKKISIWHRENGNLIQTLEGHEGPVTVVSWNMTTPTMFASASDDNTIRIWGTPEDVESDLGRVLNGSVGSP